MIKNSNSELLEINILEGRKNLSPESAALLLLQELEDLCQNLQAAAHGRSRNRIYHCKMIGCTAHC